MIELAVSTAVCATPVCAVADIPLEGGVAALVAGHAVAGLDPHTAGHQRR